MHLSVLEQERSCVSKFGSLLGSFNLYGYRDRISLLPTTSYCNIAILPPAAFIKGHFLTKLNNKHLSFGHKYKIESNINPL